MTRRYWHDLPPAVRAAIEQRVGGVAGVRPVATGSVSDLVAVLDTRDGQYFCKAVDGDNPLGWMHRNEARLNSYLPDRVPRLRWRIEQDGWLLLGFDHVPGRHPDLGVGSRDLPTISATLTAVADELTPGPPVRVQPATERWAGWIEPEMVDGQTLAHTDVSPRNVLLRCEGVAVVDWSMPCRGAAWVDTALMVIRLIRAGHTASQAEAWAGAIPAWAAARPEALDAFAAAIAALTRVRHQQSPARHRAELAAAAAHWSAHRTGS
ncbi:phosphotransferase [Krasilnikovia sp. MM14-A1004]|uniref:phosphotransferase n=1 Tax=Krasilnikovia sp. MM14-A1004 TaxID=3373541 RepID=UPI00399C8559